MRQWSSYENAIMCDGVQIGSTSTMHSTVSEACDHAAFIAEACNERERALAYGTSRTDAAKRNAVGFAAGKTGD